MLLAAPTHRSQLKSHDGKDTSSDGAQADGVTASSTGVGGRRGGRSRVRGRGRGGHTTNGGTAHGGWDRGRGRGRAVDRRGLVGHDGLRGGAG